MTHPLARPVEADAAEMETIRLNTAPPVSSSPTQPPPLAVKRPDATPAFRRAVINFVCRLDVCWTFFFFLFLVCVAAITTAITQTKISRALLENLHDIHSVRIATVEKGMDLLTERSFNMAAGFLSLYAQKGFAMQSEETLSRLCGILTAYDGSKDFKSLAVTSLARKEAISCMHGDANLGSKSQLYGWMTNQSIIPGVYLISNTTYTFLRPLQLVYGGWPTSVYNLSSTYDTLLSDNPAFTEAAAYFNGSIEYIDYRTLWRAFPTIPHIIYCNIPASFLFRGLNLPSNINVTDYVDVRVDGSTLLTTSNAASATRVTAAIFVNASLSDKDPLVMSDNWGQPSVNDTEILTTYTPGQVTYLPVSNVSDPLMRAALKHVDLKALQKEGHSQNADFQFHGAPATVTATTYTTPKGLVLPMVFVSSHADIAMPYRRIMDICNGVTAVVILLFTALFWYFIKSQLRDPLADIATLLLYSVKRGTRALFRANRNHCVTLTEVQQLATAHNNAMRQLREIDTFIPEAVRQEIFHGNRMRLSQSLSRSQTSQSLRSSLRAHAKLLLTHLTTVVYINIRPSRVAHHTITGAELRDGADQLPQRQRLAAVVANAARAGDGTNTWPFSTSAVLGVFAEKLHELCVLHHGTVHRLCPDGGVVHFNKAVRAHLFVASSAASAKSASGSGGQTDGDPHTRDAGLQRDERRCATQDAKDALAFAFGLQGWLGGFAASSVPDVRLLIDTSTFTCGHYRARGSDTTQSIALGRDVQREVGAVPAIIGVRIAMTEETASCLRAGATNDATGEIEPGVRQLPVEALRTGRVGLDADVVVLYEALPGPVLSDVAWQRYQLCCFDGFSFMVRGNYAAALQAYRRVMDISDLEPGLMPTSLRREAAATSVTGGAVSVQVERLMRECVQHLLKRCTEGFHRRRQCPLGIDAVLKGAVHYSPTGGCSKRAASFPLKENADFVAKRLGRYGVESHNATFTRTEGRNVGILPGTDTRTSYTGRPNSITDNWGTKWALAKSLVSQRAQKTYSSLYSGLSETGNLCALTFLLYREVPAMVSRVLRDAPAGAMTDAMRSAVPVWQPTPPQRAAVCALLDARMRLRHPHILACLGYSLELEGGVMAALEYCKGGNLREVMARYDRVRVPTVCRTALSVLLGLRYLHAHGVVHGELRPECVLVCSDGVCRLKGFFTDYALAHRVLCIPRTCYVSPEVAAGAAPTAASDVFGYGLLLLELLTQRLPWAWAAGGGAEPPRSAEDLAALAAAGGQAFSDAVVQGLVVPAVERLDDPEVVAVHPACSLAAVRACLPMNPRGRVSLEELISMSEGTAALIGLKATVNIDGGSSTDDGVLSSVFGAPNA